MRCNAACAASVLPSPHYQGGALPRWDVFDQSQSHALKVAIGFSTMFEVVIIERGPSRWEWQVCDRDGVQILQGREKTRAEANYQGNRALFSLLSSGWKPVVRPKRD